MYQTKYVIYAIGKVPEHGKQSKNTQPQTDVIMSPNCRSNSFDHFLGTFLWPVSSVLPHILININIFSPFPSPLLFYPILSSPYLLFSDQISKGQKNWEINRECSFWVRERNPEVKDNYQVASFRRIYILALQENKPGAQWKIVGPLWVLDT